MWQLWSGHTEPLILAFGLISVLGVMVICRRMDHFANAPRLYRLGVRPVLYLPWLLGEIVKSNIDVAKIILDPELPISPRLIRVKASQRTAIGQVLYANSITLTPGTISLDIRDDHILIHALTKDAADGVETGEMDERVSALERRV